MQCAKIWRFYGFCKQHNANEKKKMMFSREEMMKIAKHTLQIKTEMRFTKTSSFVI